YNLLREPERLLLARLSIFRGTFSLRAAEVLCAEDDIVVFDLLDELVQKSLVQSAGVGERRYRLLETVREYAHEKLREAAEADRIQLRAQEYYVALAESAGRELRGRNQTNTLDLLEAELDNLRGGIRWSLDRDQGTAARRLGGA